MIRDIEYSVILFLSTNHAVKAESILLKGGFLCKLIPVPRNISSDCGVCVRIPSIEKKQAIKVLTDSNIEFIKTDNI
jgi:hypothetical protein